MLIYLKVMIKIKFSVEICKPGGMGPAPGYATGSLDQVFFPPPLLSRSTMNVYGAVVGVWGEP
jgi:hypothetical protein